MIPVGLIWDKFRAKVSPQGEVLCSDRDFLLEVRRGNVPGHSIVHKFGRHTAVPSGSFEKIEAVASNPSFLAAPTTVRIKAGGHVNDTAGGTGAREILVEGIASDLTRKSETIATNGASASSATSTSFWRVFRAKVTAVGAYGGSNTTAVTIEDSGGAADIIGIVAGEGQSQHAAFTIPARHTGYFLGGLISVDAGKAADIKLVIREDMSNTTAPMEASRLQQYWDGVLGTIAFQPKSPTLELPPGCDVWFEANGSGAQTEVAVDFELLLVEDGYG